MGLYFTARVVYSNHKAKKSGIIAPKPENVEETNFGAIPRTWMVTAMIWIAVFSLGKFNRLALEVSDHIPIALFQVHIIVFQYWSKGYQDLSK